jgi:hypothetical protein
VKIYIFVFMCVLVLSAVCIKGRTGSETDDHLIPFKPSIYDELRPTLYRKLCVTPANHGRMIELPAGPDRAEWAVSIFCEEGSHASDACQVTLTRAMANLDYIMQQRRDNAPLKAVNEVKVVRKDAPLQKRTAEAVRAAWLRFLRTSKPSPNRPNDPIILHGTKTEFWLLFSGGKAIKAETPDKPGSSVVTLVKVGRALAEYCETPEGQRAELQSKIERDARGLAVGTAK